MSADGRPSSAIARLRGADGEVAGAGFLASTDLVVTCAHVLGDTAPDGTVTVEFPMAAGGPVSAAAEVAGWTPQGYDGSGDIAVLRLIGAVPRGVRPARLVTGEPDWGHEAQVFGFPPDLGEMGAWASAEVRARQAAGLLQVEATEPGRKIQRGYSGAPVWSPDAGRVIGMVVGVNRGAGHDTAYLLPTDALVAAHPELGAPDEAQERPYRGLETFLEEHAELFRGRDGLVGELAARAGRTPIVVVAGPSGSGKSSLVQAGLVPRMRAAGRRIAIGRALRGATPALVLAGALAPLVEPGLGEVERMAATRELARLLGEAPGETIAQLAERLADVLIVVDQFEEASAADARTLLGLLVDLTTAAGRRADRTPRITAVVTARAGMLDDLITPELTEALAAGLVMVPPMTAGQLREAIAPPGVSFQDGLVDQLIQDAAGEPGHLPLLEFTLDRLWARREVGTLTHRAYREGNGISGAITEYADEIYETLGPLRGAARRLFLRMARPEDDGRFQRRPVRLADVDAQQRAAARELAASRLVVISRTDAGDDLAEPAHQALIDRWERLGGWLTEDRDFRVWHEELRRNREAWEDAGRDPSRLLRGAALTAAQEKANGRDADLSDRDRAYLRAGVAQENSRLRRLRSVIALMSVLVLLSAGLAIWAVDRADVARDGLRTAASRQLAEDSRLFFDLEPARSLQLAQAAWREEHTPEAWGALFAQYTALQPVEQVFQGLVPATEEIEAVLPADGGDTAVVVDTAGIASAWAGLTGDTPRKIKLIEPGVPHPGGDWQISPSGRWAAYGNGLGGTLVWDLTRPEKPIVLSPDRPTGADPRPRGVRSIAFARDESRLIVLRQTTAGDGSLLQMWDLPDGRPVAVDHALFSVGDPARVHGGSGPDEVVLEGWNTGVVLADAVTGEIKRKYPAGDEVGIPVGAARGRLVTYCRDYLLRVLDVPTGRQLRTVGVDSCAAPLVDSTTSFILANYIGDTGLSNSFLSLVDPDTGRAWKVTTPPLHKTFAFGSGRGDTPALAVTKGADGRPLLMIGGKNRMLFRQRAGEPVELHGVVEQIEPIFKRARQSSPDAKYSVELLNDGMIKLYAAGSERVVSQVRAPKPPPGIEFTGKWFDFTLDGRHLLVAHQDELVSYAVPSLRVERRITLPVPALGPPPAADRVSDAWASSVLPADDDVLVLHAGLFTRWDLDTGQRLGEPVPLRTGDTASQRRGATLGFATMRRPRHLDQVAVAMPDGNIHLWDLTAGKSVFSLRWDAARTQNALTFSRDGRKMAAVREDYATAIVDVARPTTDRVLPTTLSNDVLGFTPNGDLLTINTIGKGGATLWSGDRGKQLMTLNTRSTGPGWSLQRTRLTMIGDGETRSVELDPDLWFRHLCAINDRPFTKVELTQVRENQARASKPCG